MNEIIHTFLAARGKFMSEMHLRHPGFVYSACRPFTKSKERLQKFTETGDSQYIYQNKLDKSSFPHDIAIKDSKDLPRRAVSDKVFDIAINPKYDRYCFNDL